jgi:diaminohydroxyphosphoribosylaminopyrimidine deaminase/5-amino-6-(5-phosphoribosylamino)uracil reductase
MTQDDLLTRALTLAEATTALASPNPQVGCVIADADGKILGEGAHLYADRDHAEIVALKQAAGQDLSHATAYVTLEPCAHHGRTGPCADALIAAGIPRVVIAAIDPNPLTRNLGIAKLREADITVDVLNRTHPIAIRARRLNDAFACSIHRHRPMVILKAALSVDGKLAPPPAARTTTAPHWLTGPAARADVQQLRHASDAILTGIGTILTDNPHLTDRTGLPRRRRLLRVILDTQLRTPIDSNLFTQQNSVISTGAMTASSSSRSGETPVFPAADASNHPTTVSDILIFCAEDAPVPQEVALIERGAEVLRIRSHNDQLDLNAALAALHDRQILSVLTEAGTTLNASLLQASLADKLVLYFSEQELGLDAIPFAQDFDPYTLQQRLSSTERTTFVAEAPHHEDVRITGYLNDPWQNRPLLSTV